MARLVISGYVVERDVTFTVTYGFDFALYGYDDETVCAVVTYTYADSPARKAGLQRGDVILSVGGEKTDTVGELRAAITGHQVGDTVEIVLMRGNDKITVNAVLEAIPEQ